MTTLYSLDQLEKPLVNPVLTIGNFDGVHRGHLALFDTVKARARQVEGQSVVLTFDPHPIKLMKPEKAPPLITPTEQKLQLIDAAGIDVILCLRFTRQFASLSAEDFVQNVLVRKIGIRELVVGYDYAFGRNREGNTASLKAAGRKFGFEVHVMDPVHIDSTLVSSTAIRQLVRAGQLDEAKKLLGRNYQITGTVKTGKNRGGRLLGFPTANLNVVDELVPQRGVYAVEVLTDSGTYQGVTNIGYNPTFDNGAFSIETHVLDFNENLVGKTIRVRFIARIRQERKFESVAALAEQIRNDIIEAREIFARNRKRSVTESSAS